MTKVGSFYCVLFFSVYYQTCKQDKWKYHPLFSFRSRSCGSGQTLDTDVNESRRGLEPPTLRRVKVHGRAAELRADSADVRRVEIEVLDGVLVGGGTSTQRSPSHPGRVGGKLSRQCPCTT